MTYVTIEQSGRAGVIGLDRPDALNAITQEMISDIGNALDIFEADSGVELVILKSNHERAFCVGIDMRRISELSLMGYFDETENFFRTQNNLILRIANFTKPLLSLIEGVCMGSGLGLSMQGKYRIATENVVFAMPDTTLGFFPNAGASYFLPRMPLHSGFWIGLGGARIKKHDALTLGLSTHLTSSEQISHLFDELCHSDQSISAVLSTRCSTSHYQRNLMSLVSVTYCFSKPTLCSMCDCLSNSNLQEGMNACEAIRNASPRSLQETLTLLKSGLKLSLEQSLRRELETAKRALSHPDLAEGVRTFLVDKDQTLVWQSSHSFTVKDTSQRQVATHQDREILQA